MAPLSPTIPPAAALRGVVTSSQKLEVADRRRVLLELARFRVPNFLYVSTRSFGASSRPFTCEDGDLALPRRLGGNQYEYADQELDTAHFCEPSSLMATLNGELLAVVRRFDRQKT